MNNNSIEDQSQKMNSETEEKLEKKDVLFVGDTMWDKMAAERANITFVGFKINGDKRISDLKELLEMV